MTVDDLISPIFLECGSDDPVLVNLCGRVYEVVSVRIEDGGVVINAT